MSTRPTSLSILGWAFIVLSLLGLPLVLVMLNNPAAMQLMESYRFPVLATLAYQAVSYVIHIVIGIAILKGRAWSRVAYVVVTLSGFAFGLFNVPVWAYLSMLPGMVLVGVAVYLLYRRPATEYFRREVA